MQSVLQCLHRGGDAAAAVDHDGGAVLADGHDGRVAQQAAEVQHVAGLVADGGDDAHGGGLAVHHADGGLVCDQAADDLGARVARDDDHVDADGADRSHGLELFQRQAAAVGGVDHAVILRHGDERAGQAADVVGCHDAALLDRVVQQGQAGRRAAAAAALKAHLLQNVRNAVANRGRRGQRQVNDARGHAEALTGEVRYQLAQAGDLECRALDQLGHLVHRGVLRQLGQRGAHRTGAGDADVDLTVRLARAVERARHERVVLGRVAEHDELCVAHAHVVLRQLGGLAHDLAHQLDGVHVDARFRRADIDAGADNIGLGQCAGDGGDQPLIARGKALVYQRTEAADEVDPHGLGRAVQRFGVLHGVGVGRGTQQHRNGRDADALVDDGDAVFGADAVHDGDQIARQTGDLVVDFLARLVRIRVDAVQQADAHCDGAHVEVLGGQHLNGLHNVAAVDDSHVAAPLNGVHGIKDFLPGHGDLHLHLFAQCRKAVPDLGGLGVRLAQIDQHDHAEHILHDGLGNVLNVDVQLGAHRADLGNDTHRVLPDDRDDCFHKMTPSKCPMINGILPL